MSELRISLSCGENTEDFCLSLPSGAARNIIQASPVPGLADFGEAVRQALSDPIASPPLKELILPGQKVVIIVNDITRRVKSEEYMPVLVEYLNDAGIPDRDITVLIATGTHRPVTEEELRRLLGSDLVSRLTIRNNIAGEPAEHIYLGTTSRGTPVKLNRLAVNSDHVILTGGINFHFLAGFSGGRKSILPGIASSESIQANHSLVLEAGSNVAQGLLQGNPIAEDMLEAAALIKPTFLLNVVLNEKGLPAGVFAGHWDKAHRAGCDFAARCFGIKNPERRPLVIASAGGFPKDINLYQAAKGLLNAMLAVEEGGTVIFLAECREGIGDDDYYRFAYSGLSQGEKIAILRREFSIARFIGYLNSLWATKANIKLISTLPEDKVRAMGMQPCRTLDEAMIDVTASQLENCWVIPHAAVISLV